MAHQGGLIEARRIDQLRDPVGQILDSRQWLPAGAAMSGEIDRKNRAAMMGQIAGLEAPDRVIHAGTMDQHGQRSTAVKLASPGGSEYGVAGNSQFHDSSTLLGGAKGLAKVGDQVVSIFQADR